MLEITKRGLEEGLLGVIISDDLKWNAHIEYVIAKAAKRLYALRLLKCAGVLPEDKLKVYKYMYNIRSVLELDCSQSSIFRKIIEIESFVLRAAILDECQNYLGGGGQFGRKREK